MNSEKILPNNVVKIEKDTIEDYFNVFIGKRTVNTGKAYKTAVNLMTNFLFGRDAVYITFEEIKSIKMIDVMKLYTWMKEDVKGKDGEISPRYKINTRNKHINGMRSFFRFLGNEFDDINTKIFNNIELENPKKDIESYDGLEWKEALSIWKFADNEKKFGSLSKKLSLLFKIASVTSIRLESLLNLTWSKNWKTKSERGVVINYIDIVDKGKRTKKPVSEKFYNELRDNLTEDKMFDGLNKNNVNKFLKECLDELGFPESRNIKFHSFKKAGVMRALDITDNIYKAQEQGGHSSIKTTEEHYLMYQESLQDMVSYSIEESVDIDRDIADFSKEELLQAISKMREVSKKELLIFLKG